MAYIGRSPVIGSFKKIDDLTSQFNGAQTVFTLLSNGSGVDPGTSQNLLVSLGGVIQEPVTAYTVSGSTITFSSAPANTQSFFAVQLGDALDVGYLTQGVSIDVTNVNAAGIMNVAGDVTLSSNLDVLGYLTVGNNTITMNSTTLIVGNATSNMVLHSAGISMDGVNIINTSGASNNAVHLDGQTAAFYTNASNLNSGTLSLARLDANVLLTTSTTGINASALSIGTVPLGRLSSANSSANGIVDTTTQTFAGNKSFANDVTITGNLNVLGSTTTVSANNLIVDDSLIQLGANNTTSDALDIGLFGNYNPDGGAHEHAGLFRDATDNTWKLFVGLQNAPTTTVNTAGVGYTIGTLQTYLSSGILSTNSSALAITANSTVSAALTVNTVTATTFTGDLTGTASDATNLNSQPGSYYTNASNISTGSLAHARLATTTAGNLLMGNSTGGIQGLAMSGDITITSAGVTAIGSGKVTSAMIADGTIVNGDISASAAIAVSKLAASTISGVTLGNNLSAVTFNNGGSGAASGSTYNGSGALTVSYNTVGAPSTGGSGASGTWGINISGSSASTTQTTFSRVRTDGINRGSYGAISISGSTNGYSGIDFGDASATFMVRTSDGLSGIYKSNSTWAWYFDGSGVLTVGTVPYARTTGVVASNGSTWTPHPSTTRDASWNTFYTDNGYIQLGPANASWAHIYSDKSFYFNQALYELGNRVLNASNYTSYALPLGGGINMTGSFGLNDQKLYLRTNGDNNHYLWNADDDWEELVAYSGTGFRVKSSSGTSLMTFSTSAVNAGVALQQGGNQVLHSGNYSSYALPLSGGTVSGSMSTTSTLYAYGQGNTGSSAGIAQLNVYSTGGNGAIMAFHRGGSYAVNMGLDSDNVFRIGGWSAAANRLQLDMSGNITVPGAKNFEIVHPVDPTKKLRYGAIEGPRIDVIHRGTALVIEGAAQVNLDEYAGLTPGTFAALARDVQCFVTNNESWVRVRGTVSNGILHITAEDATAPAFTVDWLVIGERQDAEILKSLVTDETGRLINEYPADNPPWATPDSAIVLLTAPDVTIATSM